MLYCKIMQGKNILESVADKSSDEFYTPIPEGYVAGKTKYIITFRYKRQPRAN